MSKTDLAKAMNSEWTKYSQDTKFFKVKLFVFPSKVESQLGRDAGGSCVTERQMNFDTDKHKAMHTATPKFYMHRKRV